jgi:threonylcarbamoyladenosine tRNA methylthiotransferase MtaB
MPQFHLSLQSGSAGVLHRMRRRYTKEEYMRSVDRLRKFLPDCAITTDILTAFPGETDEEAEETLAFVRDCSFARIHVFPYSRRVGTVADLMDAQIPEEIKRQRAKELLELGNQLEEAFVESLTGTVQEALFERPAGDTASEGYTGQYVRVQAQARPGEIRSVRILRREGTLAFGEVTQDGR